jgi:hypothetical protein
MTKDMERKKKNSQANHTRISNPKQMVFRYNNKTITIFPYLFFKALLI